MGVNTGLLVVVGIAVDSIDGLAEGAILGEAEGRQLLGIAEGIKLLGY